MYRIENLSFSINGQQILNDISFKIKDNNFLSVIGTNGSGKTTLLKIINKNIGHYQGNIFLNEKNIEKYSSKELALRRAVLNQSFDFSYNFSVQDLLRMSLEVHEISYRRKKEIENFLIDKLNLQAIVCKRYPLLSGGQKQRVQLARVLAQIFITPKNGDKFLFLDEPTLNLDIYRQYEILELLKSFVQEYKIGVCAVLHDLHQAYLYSNQVLILKEGKLAFFGATKKALIEKNILQNFSVYSDFVYSEKLKQKYLFTAGKTNT